MTIPGGDNNSITITTFAIITTVTATTIINTIITTWMKQWMIEVMIPNHKLHKLFSTIKYLYQCTSVYIRN